MTQASKQLTSLLACMMPFLTSHFKHVAGAFPEYLRPTCHLITSAKDGADILTVYNRRTNDVHMQWAREGLHEIAQPRLVF